MKSRILDNQKVSKENEEIEKEGSYIIVYVSRVSNKLVKIRSNEKNNLYQKYIDIRNPSLYETFQSETNVFGRAVYFMTFSQDQSYLLIYYQVIDNFQTRGLIFYLLLKN